ncbi:MAG TPA: hypothetical protein QF514_03615 [Candidatus Thalassarchaeaceae archaeon]|jgi:hypothetical protein|nr:hypothetical protein [Candidatus Thalassarchaeaceae archaeon]HJM41295.1 hypothetical protein [Candidatus Thalassarchaeaceae archaeon]
MSSIAGWFVVLLLTGVIGLIGWWQWKSYVTLDQRIDRLDSTLIDSAGTRVEKVLDAPPGSVVVPYVASTLVPVQNTMQMPVQIPPTVSQSESSVRLVQD